MGPLLILCLSHGAHTNRLADRLAGMDAASPDAPTRHQDLSHYDVIMVVLPMHMCSICYLLILISA